MLDCERIPRLIDQFQACALLGVCRSEFYNHISPFLTVLDAPPWEKRKRKRGEKRGRGRPAGYRKRLFLRDEVLRLRILRPQLMQNRGGVGSFRSWQAALREQPDATLAPE